MINEVMKIQEYRMARFMLIAFFLVAGSSWATTVYKWVDEDGQVHFGERPPQEQQFETLNLKDKQPKVKQGITEDVDSEHSTAMKKNDQLDKSINRQKQLTADVKFENCRRAKKNLRTLYQNKTVSRTGDGKKSTTLSTESRLNEIKQTKKEVKDYCS